MDADCWNETEAQRFKGNMTKQSKMSALEFQYCLIKKIKMLVYERKSIYLSLLLHSFNR